PGGHQDLVPHPSRGVQDDAVRVHGREPSGQARDHERMMCVRATATPSAASDGRGAGRSPGRRATSAATCALGAPPAPTTVFLMRAGEYSAMVTPACSAANRTTPRACPRTRVVRTFL